MKLADQSLAPAAAELLARRIEEHTGLAFPPEKSRDLLGALGRMAAAGGFEGPAACAAWLLDGPWDNRKADLCAQHLTTGETYFFREARAFELVAEYARDKLRDDRPFGALRIWSAGCCTGEEPYSIAMALHQAMPGADWSRIHILATDLNDRFLEAARRGVYREWSFRTMGAAMRNRYFHRHAESEFRIDDEIRNKVDFARLNLVTGRYPSAATATEGIDIIFCRNVLMYFSRARAGDHPALATMPG